MILESLMNVTNEFLTNLPLVPGFLRFHVGDHGRIREAIRNKDLRLAERLLEQHSLNIEELFRSRRIPWKGIGVGGSQYDGANNP
jgi:DNA-binding GntR family transcriptional regulator